MDLPPASSRAGLAIAALPSLLWLAGGISRETDLTVAAYAVVIALALLSPSLGLLGLVPLLPFREPAILSPLGPLVVGSATLAISLALRAAFARPRIARTTRLCLWLAIAFLLLSATQLALASDVLGGLPSKALYQYGQVAGVLLIFVVSGVVLSGRSVWPYLLAYLASACAVGALALVQFVRPGVELPRVLHRLNVWFMIAPDATRDRATGAIENPNYLGMYIAIALAWLLVMVVWWLWRERRWPAFIGLSAVGLMATALTLSLSRGAYAALGVAIVVALARRSLRAAAVAAVAGTLVLAVAYPRFVELRLGATFQGPPGGGTAAQDESDRLRADVALAGVRMFLDSPIAGHGFGTFVILAPRYSGQDTLLSAHNWYINVAAEQGFVGLSIYVALVAAVVGGLWARKNPLSVAALASFAVFAIFSLFGDALATVQASSGAWLLAAAGLAGCGGESDSKQRDQAGVAAWVSAGPRST